MKKWLILLHDSSAYGANLSLLSFCKTVESTVFFLLILPEKGEISDKLDSLPNCKVFVIPFRQWVYFYYPSRNRIFHYLRQLRWITLGVIGCLVNIFFILKYFKIFKRMRVDKVFSNSSAIGYGFYLSRLLGKDHVWHLREFLDKDYSLKFYFGKQFAHRAIKKSEYVICMSQSIKEHFKITHGLVAYDGFELRDHKVRKANEVFTFLIVGLISLRKGQLEAVNAFAQVSNIFPDIKLKIVGSGATAPIVEMVNSLMIQDKVDLLSYQEDVNTAYENADAVLMCSDNEAMGRVTIEAMSHGLPVIGKASGGTLELIEDRVTGLLYKSNDQLVKLMVEILSDRQFSQRLGKMGRLKFEDTYSMDTYKRRVLSYIE